MTNSVQQWADPKLSQELPGIRARGEGETVEFKETVPDQAHRVAKELAAFGTSGCGMLLIGINDNGELIGISATNGDERDELVNRMQGIARTIQPPLKFELLFAVEGDRSVIAVRVGPQDEPVFYYDDRPYIRVGRESRPATPEQVKQSVWAHPSSEHQRRLQELDYQKQKSYQDSLVRIMQGHR